MNKTYLFLLVPLLLGACRHHENRARVYTLPPQQKTYYSPYETQNRTYRDRYISPPPRPVPVGAWQGRPMHEPQMLGHAAR